MSTRVAAAVAAIAVAALIAAGIVALAGSGDPVPQVERGVPVETVLADPLQFTGRSVTVTDEADIVTDRAMTIGDRDLIVVAADPREQDFESGGFEGGQRVHATGTLRIMDAEETVDRLPGPIRSAERSAPDARRSTTRSTARLRASTTAPTAYSASC
jgi:hypothetical protein